MFIHVLLPHMFSNKGNPEKNAECRETSSRLKKVTFGYPIAGWFYGKSQLEMDDLGVPP
jgi:hypothetical protein